MLALLFWSDPSLDCRYICLRSLLLFFCQHLEDSGECMRTAMSALIVIQLTCSYVLLKPLWIFYIYLPVILLVLLALFCVSCRDPGLMERVTDEEAGEGGWFWNEQVGSFRPPGALYCRECGVRRLLFLTWLPECTRAHDKTVLGFDTRL